VKNKGISTFLHLSILEFQKKEVRYKFELNNFEMQQFLKQFCDKYNSKRAAGMLGKMIELRVEFAFKLETGN